MCKRYEEEDGETIADGTGRNISSFNDRNLNRFVEDYVEVSSAKYTLFIFKRVPKSSELLGKYLAQLRWHPFCASSVSYFIFAEASLKCLINWRRLYCTQQEIIIAIFSSLSLTQFQISTIFCLDSTNVSRLGWLKKAVKKSIFILETIY